MDWLDRISPVWLLFRMMERAVRLLWLIRRDQKRGQEIIMGKLEDLEAEMAETKAAVDAARDRVLAKVTALQTEINELRGELLNVGFPTERVDAIIQMNNDIQEELSAVAPAETPPVETPPVETPPVETPPEGEPTT